MSTLPDHLERRTDVDLERRNVEPWFRRTMLLLLVAFIALGLADIFGQKPGSTTVRGEAADLTLSAPAGVRGGLVFEVEIRVSAHRHLRKTELVFAPGWYEGFTINTFEPEPTGWTQREGRNVMEYGPLAAGEELVVHLQYQANPTALGRRDQDLSVADDGMQLVSLEHRATVYP